MNGKFQPPLVRGLVELSLDKSAWILSILQGRFNFLGPPDLEKNYRSNFAGDRASSSLVTNWNSDHLDVIEGVLPGCFAIHVFFPTSILSLAAEQCSLLQYRCGCFPLTSCTARGQGEAAVS